MMLKRLIFFTLIIIDIISLITIIYLVSISNINNINIAIQLTIFIGFLNIILCSYICISKYYENRENRETELLAYIDNNDDIHMIHMKINEYIDDNMTLDNKIEFIKLLNNDLINNKRLELLILMLNRLKSQNQPITEEIFNNELEFTNMNYELYIHNLNIKLNAVIELQRTINNINIV